MSVEVYYVIMNEKGEFFAYDNNSGGYPYFGKNFKNGEKFKTMEMANDFLHFSEYTQRMFKKEFVNCVIKKVAVTYMIT